MKEKSIRSGRNQEKITTFAKNTAHNERRLLNFSYLCTRGGESVAVIALEAFSFFQLVNFDNLPMNKWKSEDVLPFVMIV